MWNLMAFWKALGTPICANTATSCFPGLKARDTGGMFCVYRSRSCPVCIGSGNLDPCSVPYSLFLWFKIKYIFYKQYFFLCGPKSSGTSGRASPTPWWRPQRAGSRFSMQRRSMSRCSQDWASNRGSFPWNGSSKRIIGSSTFLPPQVNHNCALMIISMKLLSKMNIWIFYISASVGDWDRIILPDPLNEA